MADTNTTPETKPDGKDGKAGAPDGKTSKEPEVVTLSKADFEELKDRRDSAHAKARKLQERLDALEAETTERNKKDAEGDIAKLTEISTAEIAKAKADADKWKSLFHVEKVEKTVKAAAAKVIAASCLEDFWALARNEFELAEEGESLKVVIKGNPYKGIDEYLNEWAESRPHFAINVRKGGSGDAAPGDGKSEGSALPANFTGLPKEQQVEWFRKHPNFKA